jgi:serine/threonine protein kinase
MWTDDEGEPEVPLPGIGHVDITPENMMFRDGEAVALIDFDLAKWATRADEVWAPLVDPVDVDPLLQYVDVPRRCRRLAWLERNASSLRAALEG